jgi:hypothetical protein
MANYATITNAQFNTAVGLVPGPFGPLTRVGNLEAADVPQPNSHIRFAVTGQGGKAFFISYDELSRPDVRDDVIREAYGLGYIINDLKDFAEILNASAARLNVLTSTPEQYRDTFNLFKTYPPIIGLTPVFDMSEQSKSNILKVSFTVSGTGANRSVVNTSTGYDLTNTTWDWDWGDGTAHSTVEDPTPHTYAADGSYTITLRAGGRGGRGKDAKVVVVDVP